MNIFTNELPRAGLRRTTVEASKLSNKRLVTFDHDSKARCVWRLSVPEVIKETPYSQVKSSNT